MVGISQRTESVLHKQMKEAASLGTSWEVKGVLHEQIKGAALVGTSPGVCVPHKQMKEVMASLKIKLVVLLLEMERVAVEGVSYVGEGGS